MTTKLKNKYRLIAKLNGSISNKEAMDNSCEKCHWHLNNMPDCVKLLQSPAAVIDMTEFMFRLKIKNSNNEAEICLLFEKKK